MKQPPIAFTDGCLEKPLRRLYQRKEGVENLTTLAPGDYPVQAGGLLPGASKSAAGHVNEASRSDTEAETVPNASASTSTQKRHDDLAKNLASAEAKLEEVEEEIKEAQRRIKELRNKKAEREVKVERWKRKLERAKKRAKLAKTPTTTLSSPPVSMPETLNLWPRLGSKWSHWCDLLLATQLAALQQGFSGVGKYYNKARPDELVLKCTLMPIEGRANACQARLFVAKMERPAEGVVVWRIASQEIENYESSRHPNHVVSVGRSMPLKEPLSSARDVFPGLFLQSWRQMHYIEGSVRAHARKQNRFVNVNFRGSETIMTCVLGVGCPFLLRFSHMDRDHTDKGRFLCKEVVSQHTCVSSAGPIPKWLDRGIACFANGDIQFRNGCLDEPHKRMDQRKADFVSVTKANIGDYPIQAAGANVNELSEDKADAPSSPSAKASSDRIHYLTANIAIAEAKLSDDEGHILEAQAKFLKLKMKQAEREAKVGRWKRKLEREKKRAQRDKKRKQDMEDAEDKGKKRLA
ncbi:hypothetical protein JCM10908_007181 [Rhodotorula pacifica]|uniref:uncharacterized protein n=1 Tax=Rhodotorula pacifica TaxID=1495444 RepID=UPI003177228C